MAHDQAQIAALATEVLAHITDAFEVGDAGELLLTCPFDGKTTYDLYQDDGKKTWALVLNDDVPVGLTHATAAAAKRAAAELIAIKLLSASAMIKTAKIAGIDVSDFM